jgi:hypothetical protein
VVFPSPTALRLVSAFRRLPKKLRWLNWNSLCLMKLDVGVTGNDWYHFLSNLPKIDAVNFWQHHKE